MGGCPGLVGSPDYESRCAFRSRIVPFRRKIAVRPALFHTEDERVDPVYALFLIASFLVGVYFGGKYTLVLAYKYHWSARRIIALGFGVAFLAFLLAPSPLFDLLFQLAEPLPGGSAGGIGVGLALYGYFFHTGNVEQLNIVWTDYSLFSDEGRKKLIEESQKRRR